MERHQKKEKVCLDENCHGKKKLIPDRQNG